MNTEANGEDMTNVQSLYNHLEKIDSNLVVHQTNLVFPNRPTGFIFLFELNNLTITFRYEPMGKSWAKTDVQISKKERKILNKLELKKEGDPEKMLKNAISYIKRETTKFQKEQRNLEKASFFTMPLGYKGLHLVK